MRFVKTIISLVITTAVVGCGTFTTGNQKLSEKALDDKKKLATTFSRQGIKIEWDCIHKEGIIWKTCTEYDVTSIETTAYGVAFGATESQRERAFKVAEAKAKAKLAHFIREDMKTSSTVNTFARNIEKAKTVNTKATRGEFVVELNDADANDKNYESADASSDTAQTISETITMNAAMIMRGIRTIDEKVVDRRTVAVTIRWDQTSDNAATSLQRKFNMSN